MHQLLLIIIYLKEWAHCISHLCAIWGEILRIFINTPKFPLTRNFLKLRRLALSSLKMSLALSITNHFSNRTQSTLISHQKICMTHLMMLTSTKVKQLLLIVHFVLPCRLFDTFGLTGGCWRLMLPRLLFARSGTRSRIIIGCSCETSLECLPLFQIIVFVPFVVIVFVCDKLAFNVHLIKSVSVIINWVVRSRTTTNTIKGWFQTRLLIIAIQLQLLLFIKIIKKILMIWLNIANLLRWML